jgi:exosortase
VALAQPLQRLATLASTYVLQTLGLPAVSEGDVILLNEGKLKVVEACNGLGMLVTFFALAAAVACVARRPLWQKLVLVASAVPIALLSNVTRIAATGVLLEIAGSRAADVIFHDLAGWLMMPFALVLLGVELQLLSQLFVKSAALGPLPVPLNAE